MPKLLSAHEATLQTIAASLRAGRATAALQTCTAALADQPDDTILNALASAAALQAERYADAEHHARRALGVRADHGPTLVLLGRALRGLGRRDEAVVAFEAAVRHAPDAPTPVFLLCATLLQNGDPRAAAMLDGLLTRFPGDGAGWEEIGLVLAQLGKPLAALSCFERAMRSAPAATFAVRIGSVLKDLGRSVEAVDAFRQATDLDARSIRAWFMLGVSLQDIGDRAAAARAYGEALRLDPGLAEAAVNLGTVLQEDRDLDGAKVAYGKALASRPDTFGRIAQAMTTSPRGELWLDLGQLRRVLAG